MPHAFSRTEMVLGSRSMETLKNSRVAVFGIGGVGGHVVEALARSGIGALDLIDNDQVALTNLNRQIIALHSTIGRNKVDVAAERVLDINPECHVRPICTFFLPETKDSFDFAAYDYVVDAIDTVSAKLCLVQKANQWSVPIISAMGAGNKLEPGRFHISDITRTHTCPLARVMRRELRKRGIRHLKVIWSDEPPNRPIEDMSISCRSHCICPPGAKHKCTERRDIPGSTAFVPAVAGLMIAAEVIRDLTKDCPREA